MYRILWISLGLFENFDKNFKRLKMINSKKLFINSLLISSLGLIAFFLGTMLAKGVGAPHTVFFQLLAVYISSYLFLCVVLTGLNISHYKTNILQFFGLYLLMDFPLLAALPFFLIGYSFPILQTIVGIISFILWASTVVLKIKLFMKYFNISFSQVLVLYTLPTVLLFLLVITSTISIFNTVVALF
ncbi:MAG: hypothetical protein ACRCWI_07250 [Brevinema sp.]